MSRWKTIGLPLAVVIALLAAWEVAAQWDLIADAFTIRDFLIPAPSDVAATLWEERALLAEDAWVTLSEVLLGFLVALVLGVAFAVVLHLSPTMRRAFYPLLVASQTIPTVAVAPILVVWFGFGIGPKLAADRADLLLPDHGQHARRAALGRSRPDQDDADARSVARPDRCAGPSSRGPFPSRSAERRSRSPSRSSARSSPSGRAPTTASAT